MLNVRFLEPPARIGVAVIEQMSARDHLDRHDRRGTGEIHQVDIATDVRGQSLLDVEPPLGQNALPREDGDVDIACAGRRALGRRPESIHGDNVG